MSYQVLNSNPVVPTNSRHESYQQLRRDSSLEKAASERRRYIYSGLALLVALTSFVVQTETAGYMANTLKYRKPIFCLYLTHSSWTFLWPIQMLFLRVRKMHMPFRVFLRAHLNNIQSTAGFVIQGQNHKQLGDVSAQAAIRYILKMCGTLFIALTIAGSSWYVAVNLTTPSDLTAIYNCSAFFAYAFSVVLLKESIRVSKVFSVLLAIAGVLVVSYADSPVPSKGGIEYPYRTIGNLIIGVGAVLYGLYEVLYKKLACPPSSVSPRRQAAFANVIGSCIGFITVSTLWIILPILHFTGLEVFERPSGTTLTVLLISVFSNMLFSGSFLILMSLTSPVLSSVAALLTIFLVAVVDYLLFGTPIGKGGIFGGIIIVIAFGLLSYDTWRELHDITTDDDEDEE